MRLLGPRCLRHLAWALCASSVGSVAACSIYEESPPGASAGGASGTGATTATSTTAGDPTTSSGPTSTETSTSSAGIGGAGGEGVTVGTGGSAGDSSSGGAGGEQGGGAGTGSGGSGIVDAGSDPPHDSSQEAEASPPLPLQTLPPHGVAVLTNLAVPFTSACNADEVVIGFSIRAGAWTDAIASICSRFSGGMLGAIRLLPLNGKGDGGNPQQLLCPTNFVATGVVGNYGHSIRFNVDQMTGLGVVCRDIANSANLQVVAVTQTPLDTDGGMIAFREDCTVTRWLTSMTGTLDNNQISGQSVVRLGGECNSR